MENYSMQIPISSLPIVWIIFAALCILGAVYLAIFGYKRSLGQGGYFPMKILGQWLNRIFKGEAGYQQAKVRFEMDKKWNLLMVFSSIAGSFGLLLMAGLSLLVANYLTRNGGTW